MASKEDLIKQAQDKWEHDQLIAQAQKKWASEQAAPAAEPAPDRSFLEKLETGARSGLEGMTLGLSEPVISGINAGVGQAMDAVTDSNGVGDFASRLVDTDHLKQLYKQDAARREQLQKDLPLISTGSEIAGAVIPAFIPGGQESFVNLGGKAGALMAKGARGATEMIPGAKGLMEGGSVAGRAARIARGAIEGGAVAAGSEGMKRVVEMPTGFMDPNDEQSSLAESALLGAKFGGVLSSAPEALGLVKSGAKNVMSALGGVKPATIENYLNNADAIRNAKSIPDVKDAVDAAMLKVQQGLQNNRADFSDNVVQAVDALKDKVVKGSQEAYDILDAASKRNPVSGTIRKGTEKVTTSTLKKAVTDAKRDLEVSPGVSVGPSAKSAVGVLDNLREDLNLLPKEITLSQAKHILQSLDENINYSRQAGQFGDEATNALKFVRGSLDSMVKTKVPEYAEKMVGVASDTRLLSDMADKFGDNEKVFNKLDRLVSDRKAGFLEGKDLLELEKATGTNLSGQLNQIKQAAPIMGLKPETSESFIKSIMNGNSIEARKKLGLLSKLSDQDLVSLVDNTGVAESFNKEFRAGSQHTNLWAMVGGAALGGLTGDQVGGGVGLGTGAVVGAMVTKFGPAMTRKILDGYLKLEGIPTVQKIDQAFSSVPDSVRKQLKADLVRGVAIADEKPDPIYVPEEHRAQTRQDIKNTPGLSVIEKARALDQVNRGGYVSPNILRKAMIGNHPPVAPVQAPPMPAPSASPVAPNLDQLNQFFKQKKVESY